MNRGPTEEDPTERQLFETIRATYSFVLQPEQHAMIRQLRSQLHTVPVDERTALIDDIERSIGENIEEELEF